MHSTTKRIDFIDLSKGICILLVIFSHCEECFPIKGDYKFVLSSFRMPLYFMLSGMFFKSYGNFKTFIKKKVNKLIIPFLFFYIVIALILPMIVRYCNIYPMLDIGKGIMYVFCIYNENFNGMPMGIWFLWCLFIVNIISYCILWIANCISKDYKDVIHIMTSILIGSVGYYLGRYQINLPLYIDSAMTAMPFFSVGYLINNKTNFLFHNKLDKYNILLAILGFILIYYIIDGGAGFRENRYNSGILALYMSGIVGSISVLLISKTIKYLPIVSFMGRYSIIVLCTHQLFILVLKQFFEYSNIDNLYITVVLFVITSILCYFIIYPLKKYLPYFTAQKELIK